MSQPRLRVALRSLQRRGHMAAELPVGFRVLWMAGRPRFLPSAPMELGLGCRRPHPSVQSYVRGEQRFHPRQATTARN